MIKPMALDLCLSVLSMFSLWTAGGQQALLYKIILLPAGTSIVLPVGYMNQPTGPLHIYL